MQSIGFCYLLLCGIYSYIAADEDIFYSFLKVADSTIFPANLLSLLHSYHISNLNLHSITAKTIDASKSSPVERLIFLKTHKTGSSTLNRILWRSLCIYGGYNCFLPPAKNAGRIWNLDKIEDYNYITNNGGSNFNRTIPLNVWLHHIYYNEKLFTKIIPNHDFLVTITRNPSERFVSAWNWYEHEGKLTIPLSTFIQSYDNSKSCKVEPFHCENFEYRTGLDSTTAELVTKVNISNYYRLLSNILRRQLLVLVTDRYDESLIILANYLNWNVTNILYFPQKVSRIHGIHNLTIHNLDKLCQIQPYDTGLYVTANFMLNKYIKEYGIGRMNRDLFMFHRAQKRLLQICSYNYTLPTAQNAKLWGAYCDDLKRDNRNEILYVRERRKNIDYFKGIDLNILFA